MAKPPPQGGLVIRYDYLWTAEEEEGRDEGSKLRPCAVVVAVKAAGNKPLQAIVCAITHSPAKDEDAAIEVPPAVKRHLGLDEERSWIIASEVNIVDWDDPGIVPVAPGRWAYGFLPPALAEAVRDKLLTRSRAGRLKRVDRPKIARRRVRRGD